MSICQNCHVNIQGRYCGNCGQKAGVGRLRMHDLWHELWHAFTHADKGILKLIHDLVIRPTEVYKRYFAGQRKLYFSPALFYLLTAGLSIFIGDRIFAFENATRHTNNEFGQFLLDHVKLMGFFLLPAEAILTWLIFYRRFNLAENAVFWLFCNGLIYIFKIAISPIYFLLINYKLYLDYAAGLIGFLIMFWQMSALFAWKRSWFNYLICFFCVNIILVLYEYAGYYILFGDKLYQKSFIEMVKSAYGG